MNKPTGRILLKVVIAALLLLTLGGAVYGQSGDEDRPTFRNPLNANGGNDPGPDLAREDATFLEER